MPTLKRAGQPALHYALDDYTDPWRKAPFLILQHGYGRSGEFWYSWVPYLSRFYRVVRPDLRGLGRSEAPADLESGLTPAAYVQDLVALIDALGAGPVHYCGESLGGILGMVLAAEHPQKLRTLSLVAAPVRINTDTQKTFAFGHPTWQDALRAMGSRGWADAANSATRFAAGTDPGLLSWYAEEMGKSRVEVLIRHDPGAGEDPPGRDPRHQDRPCAVAASHHPEQHARDARAPGAAFRCTERRRALRRALEE
jgi:3-oxoadipate enol-lactonase